MTLRHAQDGARALLAPAGLVLLLLAGCTSNFLVDGDGPIAGPSPTPTASDSASPTPTETAEPTAPPEFDCDNFLINAPGNYYLGECGTVILEGSGIDLVATSIAELVIRADNADVVVDEIGDLEISGQGSEIEARAIDKVDIRGTANVVTVEETIGSLLIEGNENVVTAGISIESAIVNGLLNEVEPAP